MRRIKFTTMRMNFYQYSKYILKYRKKLNINFHSWQRDLRDSYLWERSKYKRTGEPRVERWRIMSIASRGADVKISFNAMPGIRPRLKCRRCATKNLAGNRRAC